MDDDGERERGEKKAVRRKKKCVQSLHLNKLYVYVMRWRITTAMSSLRELTFSGGGNGRNVLFECDMSTKLSERKSFKKNIKAEFYSKKKT